MVDINTCFGSCRWKRMDASKEALLLGMHKHGIDTALTYSLRAVYYDYREGNAETLDTCSRHGEFLPVAVLDPRKMLDPEAEAQTVASQGFKAVRVFPDEQGWSVGSISFRKLLRAVGASGLPLITSAPPSALCDMTEGVNIPVIFLSMHYYRLHDTLAAFTDRPGFHAEARQLVSPDALELFVEKVGADRLLFGSNLPFDYAGSPLERLRTSTISPSSKEMILSGNACRIFGIDREGVG